MGEVQNSKREVGWPLSTACMETEIAEAEIFGTDLYYIEEITTLCWRGIITFAGRMNGTVTYRSQSPTSLS